jgi:hypothetical protein
MRVLTRSALKKLGLDLIAESEALEKEKAVLFRYGKKKKHNSASGCPSERLIARFGNSAPRSR